MGYSMTVGITMAVVMRRREQKKKRRSKEENVDRGMRYGVRAQKDGEPSTIAWHTRYGIQGTAYELPILDINQNDSP